MRNLYLIRHGQASFGTENYDQLSTLGERQSRLTGEWFRRCNIEVHHAVAGGLNRHVQTAEAFFQGYCSPEAAEGWKPRIHRDPGFNEVDQIDIMNPANTAHTGPLKDGTKSKKFEEFRESMTLAFSRWMSGEYDHEYKQPFTHFTACCTSAISNAFELASPEETIVTFTSGGTICMICRQVLNLGLAETSSLIWLIMNTSVSRLSLDGDRLVLQLFNSLAHLEHTGDAGLITPA